MVNVIPPDQWLNSYIFFSDPTYPETNLVFVRKKAPDNTFHDVTLDCSGVLGGWTNIDAAGTYQLTRADVQTGNFTKVGMCDNGRNSAHSDIPFGLTVWGWGSNATSPILLGGGELRLPGGGERSADQHARYPAGSALILRRGLNRKRGWERESLEWERERLEWERV